MGACALPRCASSSGSCLSPFPFLRLTYARDVGELTFSTRVTGAVHTSPDRVMAWWLNSDRQTERHDRMENRGCSDISTTVSTEDGVRVNVLRYRDTKGWGHEVRSEIRVGSDGELLVCEDDSYLAQVVETYTAPVYGFKLVHTRDMTTNFEDRGRGPD